MNYTMALKPIQIAVMNDPLSERINPTPIQWMIGGSGEYNFLLLRRDTYLRQLLKLRRRTVCFCELLERFG
jgi:hypothetical protein